MIVFSGPTLGGAEIEALLPGAICLPPAEKGSVYEAALGRPDGIGLIDGYVEQRLSVWHKEILWALGEGIPIELLVIEAMCSIVVDVRMQQRALIATHGRDARADPLCHLRS